MEEALVSIVIPTCKRPWEYLCRAVESVLAQTYKRVEVIIVDDSPDTYEHRREVQQNMADLCSRDDRVRYLVNEKNLGGSMARNRGIEAAAGVYTTFLDDDDEYLPEKVEHQVAFMQETGCDLSFGDMIMYNQKDEVVDVRRYEDIEAFDNETLLRYHLTRQMTGTPTFMFKTEKLRQIGGFDNAKMGQEFYLMLKAIEAGLTVRHLPRCDIKVYKHQSGSISSGKNKINGEKDLYAFKHRYFDKLTRRDRMFVRFRHYAVMVVAYLRNRNIFAAIGAAFAAFFSSPLDFFGQVFGFLGRVKKANKTKAD